MISATFFFFLSVLHLCMALPLGEHQNGQNSVLKPVQLSPVMDTFNTYLVAPITVGTPREGEKPQRMAKVIFTLGAGDTWVQDYAARKEKHCPYNVPVDTFFAENSTTFKATGQEFNTSSYKGLISGSVGMDNVKIANGPFLYMMAANVKIGQAKEYDCYFIENSISGVVGLGLPALGNANLTTQGTSSPVLAALDKLRQPFFTLKIDAETEQGSIAFGNLNPSQCANKWLFAPLSKQSKKGIWQADITSYSIGAHTHGSGHDYPHLASFLESIPYILGPIDEVNRLTVDIPSAFYSPIARTISVDCKAFHEGKLPTIKFQLAGGVQLELTPQEYVNEYTDVNCDTVFGYTKDFVHTNRMPLPLVTGYNWVFGRPLMHKYCTSFDFGKQQIGFALGKNEQ